MRKSSKVNRQRLKVKMGRKKTNYDPVGMKVKLGFFKDGRL